MNKRDRQRACARAGATSRLTASDPVQNRPGARRGRRLDRSPAPGSRVLRREELRLQSGRARTRHSAGERTRARPCRPRQDRARNKTRATSRARPQERSSGDPRGSARVVTRQAEQAQPGRARSLDQSVRLLERLRARASARRELLPPRLEGRRSRARQLAGPLRGPRWWRSGAAWFVPLEAGVCVGLQRLPHPWPRTDTARSWRWFVARWKMVA
jgi:hypothetical protein